MNRSNIDWFIDELLPFESSWKIELPAHFMNDDYQSRYQSIEMKFVQLLNLSEARHTE